MQKKLVNVVKHRVLKCFMTIFINSHFCSDCPLFLLEFEYEARNKESHDQNDFLLDQQLLDLRSW